LIALEFSVDCELRIVGCNGELEEARPGPTAGLRGRPYFEALPRIFWEGSDAVARVVNTGLPLSFSNYSFSCLFATVHAEVEIFPLKDESDNIQGARVLINASEGCQPINQLKRSQPLLDIGKHAAILSHGVRNPLNAIKGAVVYLKNRYSQEATLLEFTRIMEEEIAQLDRFITGFLSGSPGEEQRQKTDLNGMLRKLEAFTSLQARATDTEMVFSYGSIPSLEVNFFQIEQAILNVLNNSLNVLDQGGEILVESKTVRKGGLPFVVVEVSDNGPGFSARGGGAYSAPLAESARSRGRGFGLFITREILQAHGGALEISSKPGQGTTVRLYLPDTVSETP
jgi:two-component system nitrogen regulation sensor histidine kinase GlnL